MDDVPKRRVFLMYGSDSRWYLKLISNPTALKYYMGKFNCHEEDDRILFCHDEYGDVAVCDPKDLSKAKLALLAKLREKETKALAESEKRISELDEKEKEIVGNHFDADGFVPRVYLSFDKDGNIVRDEANVPIGKELNLMEVSKLDGKIVGECYEDWEYECKQLMKLMSERLGK